MKNNLGFTLIELVTVVAIVGILAVIAIPAYGKYVVRSKLVEAVSTLSAGRASMEQYYQDNRSYACSGFSWAGTQYFNYTCATSNNNQSFLLTATGVAATNGFIYTVDESNNMATPSVPSGWQSSTTSWVTR